MQQQNPLGVSSPNTTGAWAIGLVALLVAMLAQPHDVHAQSRGRSGFGGSDGGGKQASCVTSFGKTACGFDCKAAYGEIKCAQTAQGTCSASFGTITCWDPPSSNSDGRRYRGHSSGDGGRRGGYSRGGRGAQSTCESAYGTTACGYGCVAAYGTIKCAQTPGAQCLAAYGQIACGFNCEAAYGSVQCARTPRGACVASNGALQCYDPR